MIDDAACDYFNSNDNLNLENSERNLLNSICSSEKSDFHLNQIYVDRSNNFWINFRNSFKFIRYLFGKEIYYLFEEITGRLILSTDLKSLGRAGYVEKWDNQTAEAKLVANILSDIKNYCDSEKCKPIFTFFPNVEDLSKNSKIYKSYISFQKYMLDNYQIKVFNGYEPFLEKNIKRATYSLSDTHSNCKGYKFTPTGY